MIISIAAALVSIAQASPVATPPRRAFSAASQVAGKAPPPPGMENITVELSAGLGWGLCPEATHLPPLETATSCEGLIPSLDDISVTLTPQPAANPDWKLWSGKYSAKTKFQKLDGALELLISYAKVEGATYAFIEGRVSTSATGANASYFATVSDAWDKLIPTTVYGPFAPIQFGAERDAWVPYAQFSKKGGVTPARAQ